MLLTVATETSLGEERDGCGVAIAGRIQGFAAAVQDWLGLAPTFAMGLSSTHLALRAGDSWRPAAGVDRAEIARAKAQGRLYSIVVNDFSPEAADGDYASLVMLLHVQPTPQADPGR